MELCCVSAAPRGLSAALPRRPFPVPSNVSTPVLHSTAAFHLKNNSNPRSRPGLRFSGVCMPRASTSEETSPATLREKFAGRDPFKEEEEETPSEASTVVEYEEAAPTVDQSEVLDFLSKVDLKLDSENTYSLLLYGAGTFVALWISSAVVAALDSIPLIPKMMEIVGLGFTVWFTYRYLIFKKNRDELFEKVEDLKEHIIGPSE